MKAHLVVMQAVVGAVLLGSGPGTVLHAAMIGASNTDGVGLPKPTFVIPFDGSTAPTVMAGRQDHPAASAGGVKYVPGRKGQVVLLGDGPVLVYQAHKNIPEVATVAFWIKPDWEQIDRWRDVLTVHPVGRAGMMFSNYPKRTPTMQFIWSNRYGKTHDETDNALRTNAWNHVAIAWNEFRSRIYFDGKLTLSRNHPAGYHPTLDGSATLHLGGITLTSSSGSSYSRSPWGIADTAFDELVVYPGMLGPAQIAALAGKEHVVKEPTGPPDQSQGHQVHHCGFFFRRGAAEAVPDNLQQLRQAIDQRPSLSQTIEPGSEDMDAGPSALDLDGLSRDELAAAVVDLKNQLERAKDAANSPESSRQ